MLGGVHAFFDAVAQRPHDGEIHLAFTDTVFDARVDTRVVVHLDDNRVPVPFLQINAVEAVADKAADAEVFTIPCGTISIGMLSHLPENDSLCLSSLSQL